MNYQMSLDDFQNHLHNATKELIIKNNLPLDKSVVYKIELDLEENKKHNSMDEFFYRAGLAEIINKQEVFDAGEVTTIFCKPNNRKYPDVFPLWVKISFLRNTETSIIIKLLSSTRFRKHSLLKNQELGYPPFEIESTG